MCRACHHDVDAARRKQIAKLEANLEHRVPFVQPRRTGSAGRRWSGQRDFDVYPVGTWQRTNDPHLSQWRDRVTDESAQRVGGNMLRLELAPQNPCYLSRVELDTDKVVATRLL